MSIPTFQARLLESHEIAPGIRHFVFDVPEVSELVYSPGQFVSLTAEIKGKRITRAYSTAGIPEGNRFELCLNLVEDGAFSPLLFALAPGDRVEMKGPLGAFTLRAPAQDSILVATGTGVAPFRGMIAAHVDSGQPESLTLIHGVRYEHSLLYRAEFEQLAHLQHNFRYWPVLSRPEPHWSGRTGHVQPYVLEALGPRRDIPVYICGMKAMVNETRALLLEAGLDRKQIIFEKYD